MLIDFSMVAASLKALLRAASSSLIVASAAPSARRYLTYRRTSLYPVLTTRTPDMTGGPYYIDEEWFREYHRVRVGRFVDWSLGRPDTTLVVVADAGHFVHLDEPALTTGAVRQVLAAIDASP